MYSTLVCDSGEYKKVKDANKNAVAEIIHDEYKKVLLNKKCLIHSINIIQIKNQRVRTYEINKISSSCFDDKIYINFWSNQREFSWQAIKFLIFGLIRTAVFNFQIYIKLKKIKC